jgi:hypothetical protein
VEESLAARQMPTAMSTGALGWPARVPCGERFPSCAGAKPPAAYEVPVLIEALIRAYAASSADLAS